MGAEEHNLLIYSPVISSRIQYITEIILNKILGLKYEITNDHGFFENSTLPKICYSSQNQFNSKVYLQANKLLEETDIHPIDPDVFTIDGQKAFFKSDNYSFFPFDIFAASFFLISRYEEYLPVKSDVHGRFDAAKSLAFKHGFLEEPIIHIWAEMFKKRLIAFFPDLKTKEPEYKFLSTIDIDNAWAHLNKGIIRTLLSYVKLLFRFNTPALKIKTKVLLKKYADPYDNYGFMDKIHKTYGIQPITFVLFSKFSAFDKNPSIKNKQFRDLIKRISSHSEMGIHPSYQSNKSYDILQKEKSALEKLIERSIEKSRQHYLKLKMPTTYENLIRLGIQYDFSMGYSSHVGFRAGITIPFNFFNLKTNKETPLEIVPFAIMDVCFTDYLKIEPEKALKTIKKIISSVKKVNGLFSSLWHNETFSDASNCHNWRWVFEQMIIEANDRNQAF